MDTQLKRGLLDVCVLAAIKNDDSYGYKIIKDMKPYIEMSESTLYTILKRLCEKGLFVNNSGTVSSLISRDDFFARQSEDFINETFSGSLPAFIAAFSKRNKLKDADVKKLQELIDGMKED